METKMYVLVKSPIIRFKSYYVVWKLLLLICERRRGKMFKSYYVVWKLVIRVGGQAPKKGLNRTM